MIVSARVLFLFICQSSNVWIVGRNKLLHGSGDKRARQNGRISRLAKRVPPIRSGEVAVEEKVPNPPCSWQDPSAGSRQRSIGNSGFRYRNNAGEAVALSSRAATKKCLNLVPTMSREFRRF